jgi:hypothetical protein
MFWSAIYILKKKMKIIFDLAIELQKDLFLQKLNPYTLGLNMY